MRLNVFKSAAGRIAAPMLLWFMGMPLGLVLIVWFFFFRG